MITDILSFYNITDFELHGRSRRPQVVEARQMSWLMLQQAGYTLEQIGAIYNRDRSTVHSGIKHIKGIIETDKKTREFYNRLNKQ